MTFSTPNKLTKLSKNTQTSGLRIAFLTTMAVVSGVVVAQDRTTFQELSNTIKAPNAASKLGVNLFGDTVNLYNGGLDFIQSDFSLKGTSDISMGVARRFVAGGFQPDSSYHFGGWELEIPRMHGMFSTSKGWQGDGGAALTRCSQFGAPVETLGDQGGVFSPREFWQGTHLYIPGQGNQQLLQRAATNTLAPSGISPANLSPAVTKSFWSFTCKSSLANPSTSYKGEGFVGYSPDGLIYTFDHMVTINASTLTKPIVSGGGGAFAASSTSTNNNQSTKTDNNKNKLRDPITTLAATNYFLTRMEVWLLPTKVTDRFGNFVTYSYDPAKPGRVLSMVETLKSGGTGRQITFSYNLPSKPLAITSATDGMRTWSYAYNTNTGDLETVTLPDASRWQFNLAPLRSFMGMSPGGVCDGQENPSTTPQVGTITHPTGAVGTFTMVGKTHGRSNVPRICHGGTLGAADYALTPKFIYNRSLTQKTITGPGLPSMSWSYAYSAPQASWTTECTSNCVKTKTVTLTDPKGDQTRYTFGTEYQQSEGRLEKTEAGWNGSTALQTTTMLYRAPNMGPYPASAGNSGGDDMGDSEQNARFLPMYQKTTTRQGVTFKWEANQFDTQARPTQVSKTGTGGTRTETTVYHDNLATWVLGQTESVTEAGTGLVIQNHVYDANAMLWKRSQFGLLQETLTYNIDGALATKKDGLNQTTTLSDYKLGTPRLVTYANSTTESAVVNNIGLVTSLTNGVGTTTTLGYDAMGRLNSVTYPTDAGITWNNTTISFVPVASTEKGIAAGHWRQTMSTGNAQSITYLDALWRPVLTSTYDSADQANTEKSVLSKFDHNGKATFQSYPQRSIASVATVVNGVTTTYDALGRETQSDANSELGTLTTSISYLSGFTKRVTNPKGQATTTAFQAFDEPSESAPVTINAPEGVTVQITRDLFGKTKSIARSGSDGATATRSYVYDTNQRLCKTIEPEVSATIQNYDLANNVTWRATGINSTGTSTCDQSNATIAAAKTSFTYDTLNRLKTTSYADGSPTITRTYTNDGLPLTVSTNGTGTPVWTSTYNNRRLLTNESLSFEGNTYSIGRIYNSNGALTNLNYPTQSAIASVDFVPNALGEASKIGSYASNVKYYPNGAVSGFTYGNGIVHTMAQNLRGLPQQSRDVGILNDTYVYDANANVQSITDVQEGLNTRNLTYDNLDRLKTATGYFGNASYTYDSLDNLKTSSVGSRSNIHTYNTSTNLLTNISSNVGGFSFTYAYDSQGNITQRGSQLFTFDKGNRLAGATGKATYSYDGFGHRVKTANADGSTQVSVYTPAGQILFTQKTGGTNPGKTSYIYLNRHQIAEVKN